MEYANSHWMIWNLKSIYLNYALTLQGPNYKKTSYDNLRIW